jgi:hypothetical protein
LTARLIISPKSNDERKWLISLCTVSIIIIYYTIRKKYLKFIHVS